ncbi:MAG: Flp pilus assembly protein CpaB [Acidobacteria bacterium]|jgi:pilus assembly protein CpaB|nr:MAG: Flp pilus assembly protein CpaB [Acidobacteriota bacterium]
MNRTRLLFIGVVALVLGAWVSYMVYHTLQAGTNANKEPGVDVVVAANDIAVGAKIEDKDIKVARFPASDAPPGYYSRKQQILGRGVIQQIGKGEFLLSNKLAAENAGSGLPGLIPPGMRAVSVRVNEVVGVAGFVQPGTRVDVLLTGNPGSGQQQTTTVLENVGVIAAGQRLERNAAGEAQMAPVITLLVSPDDAQKLTLASTEGRIQLSLRNPLDTRQESLGSVKTDSLYRNLSAPVVRPKIRKTAVPVTPVPGFYTIEVIRGNKKEEDKF